jgi:hypothetical protein
MAVSKRLRYEILRRDSHTCRYCGASAPDVPLRVDHVTPVALGGTDTPDNLVTSCEPCNSGKSSSTVDAAVVAEVSDDALRWANAMKQAAADLKNKQAPKVAYREAFEKSWRGWTREDGWKTVRVELPDNWKGSLDAFYAAGLPQEVWPDIIEKAMTNPTVRVDNTFRYACGIAWRMVKELHEQAAVIAGGAAPKSAPTDPVVGAAVDVWVSEIGDDADEETRQSILESARAARERDVDAHKIVEAAERAAWFGLATIDDAIVALDLDSVLQRWSFMWLTLTGDYPENSQYEQVKKQAKELLAAGVYVGRLEKAAAFAGSRHSTRLHFGLSQDELALTGGPADFNKIQEVWAGAFYATADRWPTQEEHEAFVATAKRVGRDGDIWLMDAYIAAASAGAYQDTDITTCLPRHLSVFEAAARPVAPAA